MFIFLLALLSIAQAQNTDKIHTVLPKDAIPAIFAPQFVPAKDANINKSAPIIGVTIQDEHRAYSMYLLNRHEIVNDVVSGQPIATTW